MIAGCILCDVTSPVQTATRFLARIVIFNINFPITKGFPVSAACLVLLSITVSLVRVYLEKLEIVGEFDAVMESPGNEIFAGRNSERFMTNALIGGTKDVLVFCCEK